MSSLPASIPTPPLASSPTLCPRCGAAFDCGAALPPSAPCACAGVGLTPGQRAGLRARYEGCLCLDCLRAVARGEVDAAPGGAR